MLALALALLAADPTPTPAPAAPAPAPAAKAPAAKPTGHTPTRGSVTLAKVTTGKGGPTFELKVGDCKVPKGAPKGTPGECTISVFLKGRHEKLPWTTSSGGIWDKGDHAVRVGDNPDEALTVSWQPVAMDKNVRGVIVSETTGGDRVKHRHDVFLDVKGRLSYALSAGPQRGDDTWSTISPLDVDGNGTDELILVQASRPDAETEADNWTMSVWGWRADVRKVVKLPSWTPTIHAALVGSFTTVKEARELASDKCLREFVVVDNKSAPLLQEGTFAVVYPAATARDADLALEAAKACDEDIVGGVKVISQGLDVEERHPMPE